MCIRDSQLVAAVAHFDVQYGTPETFTLVESCEAGWFYSAFMPDRRLLVAFMSDLGTYRGGRRRLERTFSEMISSAPLTHSRCRSLPRRGPIRVTMAQTSWGEWNGDGAVLNVGDASYSLDPLSGQGIYRALSSSAVAAAATMRALLGDPDSVGLYHERERTGARPSPLHPASARNRPQHDRSDRT